MHKDTVKGTAKDAAGAIRKTAGRATGDMDMEADGAANALKLLDAHPEIDLLFTDVVMPEVNGRKLADEALRRRPGLKVLFTTGYTRNAVVHNGVLDAGVQLITELRPVPELPKIPQPPDEPAARRTKPAPSSATVPAAPAGALAPVTGLPGNRRPGLLAGSVLSPQTWQATLRAWQDRTVRR